MTTEYRTITDIEKANSDHGHHFFEPDTMHFFKSRILWGVYGGRYFVTSERGPDEIRRYTVREANADGSIDTFGGFDMFGGYPTADKAKRAARDAASALVNRTLAQKLA